jgi:hypothetical protein
MRCGSALDSCPVPICHPPDPLPCGFLRLVCSRLARTFCFYLEGETLVLSRMGSILSLNVDGKLRTLPLKMRTACGRLVTRFD